MKGDTKPDPDPNKRRIDEKEDFLKLVVSECTIDILRYLDEHGAGQYNDFTGFVNADTLQDRVNRLLEYNLMKHLEEESGTEQYELTDNGKKVLQIMEEIIKLAV